MTQTPREPTPLGIFVLRRMKAVGMTRQLDLAAAAGVGQSTISRLLYHEEFRPDPTTMTALADALGVSRNDMLKRVYGWDYPDQPEQKPPHPIAAEIARMLADESPLPTEERELLVVLLDRVIAPSRRLMRRGG